MTIRPGCTLRPSERPGIVSENEDLQPLARFASIPEPADTARAEVKSMQTRPISPSDLPYFRRKLHEQLTFARSTIRAALLRADSEHYAQIAGQVHDAQDESLADLLVDVNLDEIDRDVQTVADIVAAQRRIVGGTYGSCRDCSEPIDWRRLDVYPTAKRCLACQEHYEHGKAIPRL